MVFNELLARVSTQQLVLEHYVPDTGTGVEGHKDKKETISILKTRDFHCSELFNGFLLLLG